MSRRLRMQSKASRPKRTACLSVKPDPRIWEVALLLADGEVTRIRVLSPTVVIVQNHPSNHHEGATR